MEKSNVLDKKKCSILEKWWNSKSEQKRKWFFEKITQKDGKVLSKDEITSNLIKLVTLAKFTKDDIQNIIIPKCKEILLEHRSIPKYCQGTIVKIKKSTPEHEILLNNDCYAIVVTTKGEEFGDGDFFHYELLIVDLDFNAIYSTRWYREDDFEEVFIPQINGFNIVRSYIKGWDYDCY